jgi:Recombinase
MARNAVGFYWTLPVPWAGFASLPRDLDQAANVSRTIRYQRDLIRGYARDERYCLVHEEAFLEVEPDRGSDLILGPLRKVKKICEDENAILLFVDFWKIQSWRAHLAMVNWLRHANVKMQSIYPGEIMIDGKIFDPHAHFRRWREKQFDWTQKKGERIVRAVGRARELREKGYSYPQIARTLNEEQLPSLTGRPWTADNIRKLCGKPF